VNGSMKDEQLHLVTLGPQERFDLDRAFAVLLHFYEACDSDVLVLVQPNEGDA
jgi:hypothetical protein